MIKQSSFAAVLTLTFLTGCQDKSEVPDVNINPKADITISATVDVKATTHIYPKEKIIKASIAPKSGMRAFSSKILLLGESGKLYATDTAFPQIELINEGPFSDVSGFYLADNNSGFLALGTDGNYKAFLEQDGPGFSAIVLSGFDENTKLCEDKLRAPGRLAMSQNGQIKALQANVDSQAETLTFVDVATKTKACGTGNDFSLSISDPFPTMMSEKTPEDISAQLEASYNFSADLYQSQVVIGHQGQSKAINIIEGLSIGGLKTPEWVFTTSQPMGNTFNQGVTLVRGDGENRIVMIANDYLAKSVFENYNAP